jgi:pyruvate dehydrogenase E1 component
MTPALRDALLAGAYWLRPPEPGAELAIVYEGPVAPEAMAAHEAILDEVPGAGLLAVTSPDRLYAEWRARVTCGADGHEAGGPARPSHIEALLAPLAPDAALVTVLDGHPATLSWLGSVRGQRTYPLGVERFGQSGDVPDLYRVHGIDEDAIVGAVARACLDRTRRLYGIA